MKKQNFFLILVLILINVNFLPILVFSQGLVPCLTSTNPQPCEFKHILELINTIINFILFVIAVPLSAIMFAYAGFLLVFSGGSSEKMSQAKSIFLNVVIGLVIVAAAWLIVHTILNIVGFDGSWIGL